MKGLKIPVGVSSTGGAATIEKDQNDAQLIGVALSSGDNENAFQQDLSLGEDMIFDANDVSVRSKIIRKMTKLFSEFRTKKRFELKRDTIKWSTNPDQELVLEFYYVNLESDEDVFFRKTFTSSL